MRFLRRSRGHAEVQKRKLPRFTELKELDLYRPLPYAMQPTVHLGAARQRVRQLVEDLLPGALDEGTGGALDRLIESWAAAEIETLKAEHADHSAVVDRLVGLANEQVFRAQATADRDRQLLELAQRDLVAARVRLGADASWPAEVQTTAAKPATPEVPSLRPAPESDEVSTLNRESAA